MKLSRGLVLGAAVLALLGCFFLPNVVAGITDSRRLDSLSTIDSQRVSFDSVPELSLRERIILASSSNTEVAVLRTGNVMDVTTANEVSIRELISFFHEVGPSVFDFERCKVDEATALLVIDSLIPSLYMIIWEFVFSDPYGASISVALDDETGVILRMVYKRGSGNPLFEGVYPAVLPEPSDEVFYAAVLHLTELMTEYYGLPVVLADYDYGGTVAYYRADILFGDVAVHTYGVVRISDYTINERV